MRHLRGLPKRLLPKNRLFNRQHPRQQRRGPTVPQAYIATHKNRLRLLKSVGRGATWYVPATLMAVSVATAPPEMRMRTLFEAGFGVLGGAIGTKAGVLAGLGIVTILGLGPLGLFVTVLICASLGGIAFMEGGRWLGGRTYDVGESLGGHIYNSMTVFFKEHATFTRHIPDFFSSAMYASHLLMCLWAWGLYRKRKMYRDIDSAEIVTRHFSAREIRQVKLKLLLCGGMAFAISPNNPSRHRPSPCPIRWTVEGLRCIGGQG